MRPKKNPPLAFLASTGGRPAYIITKEMIEKLRETGMNWRSIATCLGISIHVQYSDIMRFTLLQNRHHKVSQSVSFFMHCKTVTILLRITVRGHFVMSITKNHESHYVPVLDNPHKVL